MAVRRRRFRRRFIPADRLMLRQGMAMRRRARRGRARHNARTGGFVALEKKFVDYNLNVEAWSVVWATRNPVTVNCLNTVTQGTGESERNGRKCKMHNCYVRGEIILTQNESQTAPADAQHFRIILVLDTQTNATEANALSVMESTLGTDYLGFRRLENTVRFKVLWDRTFTIRPLVMNEGAANLFAKGGNKIIFKIMKNFRTPIVVNYTSSADPATVAQISDNSLHIMGIATTASATLTYQSKVRFSG